MQDNQFRRFLAVHGTAAGIRTRSFRPNEAALVVVRQGTRAMGVAHKNGKLVVRIEHANRAPLFLRKQQTAVFRADDAVRVIGSLPDEFPFGASRDDPGDRGHHHFGRGLHPHHFAERAAGVLLEARPRLGAGGEMRDPAVVERQRAHDEQRVALHQPSRIPLGDEALEQAPPSRVAP